MEQLMGTDSNSNSPIEITPNKIPWDKVKLAIGASFLIFMLLGVKSCFSALTGPIIASKDFLNFLSNNELDKAYELTTDSFQKENSKEVFNAFMKDNPDLTQVDTSSVNSLSSNVENGMAEVSGYLQTRDGKELPLTLRLYEDGKSWLVNDISLTTEAEDAIVSAREFFDNLKNNKVEIAYNNSAKGFKDYGTIDDLNAFLNDSPLLKNIKNLKFDSKETKDDKSDLSGYLDTEDGQHSPINVMLVKEDGQWRVFSFDLNTKEKHDAENESIDEANVFLDYLASSDFFNAHYMMSDQYKEDNNQDKFEVFIKNYPIFTINEGRNISTGDYADDKITLYVDFTDKDKKTVSFELAMLKEYDSWHIDSIVAK